MIDKAWVELKLNATPGSMLFYLVKLYAIYRSFMCISHLWSLLQNNCVVYDVG